MALKSSLFGGDPRVEAIEVSDAANVKYGDHGPHVTKIQRALNLIEQAELGEDGIYGALTQQAVLNYKRARKIINYAYQTQADAVVGKMTIAALDEELWQQEQQPRGPMTLRVVSPLSSPADDYREKIPSKHSPMLSFAISQAVLNATGTQTPAVSVQMNSGLTVATNATIDIVTGQDAVIEIKDGAGAGITALWNFVRITDPATGQDIGSISGNSQNVRIVGTNPGTLFVEFRKRRPMPLADDTILLPVIVRNPSASKTVYTPTMTPHHHQPSRKWNEVCGKIEQPGLLDGGPQGAYLYSLCATRASPETFANNARRYLSGRAEKAHFEWYLRGSGMDFIEDGHIAAWIRADKNLRAEVADFVRRNAHLARGMVYSDWVLFKAGRYDSEDHRNSFGTIDRLYIEFNLAARYVKIWFKDMYEWHPYCPPYYQPPGDTRDLPVRTTNSLHAAMVEMKDKGAADYWMVGEATRPMADYGL